MTDQDNCPCGSRKAYQDCCQPLHQGEPASSPEALMRSRYVAFFQKKTDYLMDTWHPDTRPATLSLEQSPDWTSLQILDSSENGQKGTVHFRAIYQAGSGWGYLEEKSDFLKESGRWYYLGGETREGQFKPGRNDPCPCGSGRKHKTCCLRFRS
ncbi:YchJ family protein [Marinobacter sp. CHS3-4]|uniref:YchJ family protein n=1 Tax=Marinobacter sp. CHS3-4 TaxID=3045174 RepID=UPI0024B5B4BD|nr:YchJ family protein [Marinobacter sp. CHS3-4]MDI9244696.1 YchJ family protein [Marinobacter sp. CHS3-4]